MSNVNWDNIQEVMEKSIAKDEKDIQQYIDTANDLIAKGNKPIPPKDGPSYEELVEKVNSNLAGIAEEKKNISVELEKVANMRNSFDDEINAYYEEIEIIEAQIQKINAVLLKCDQIGVENQDVENLKKNKEELENLLLGFKNQHNQLIVKRKQIEAFPATLFGKGSPSNPGHESTNPWDYMNTAVNISSDILAGLKTTCNMISNFFNACQTILSRASLFRADNRNTSKKLVEDTNQLCDKIFKGMEQSPIEQQGLK